MSDLSLTCEGCGHPEYDCHCACGGWRGTAYTKDGVKVTGSDVVYWMYGYYPDHPGFYPMSRSLAVKVGGGCSEPMSEMYSTRQKAQDAFRLHG